jgi:predicted Rossmann fold flavoprotein
MSGPAALKLSAHAARYLQEHNYQADVAINWTGESRRNVTEEEIASIATRNPQKQLATIRPFDLPSRLWVYLLQKTQNDPTRKWGELGKKNLNRIVEALTNDIYRITGKGRFRDEFVTCGGISLSSIDMHTLQSKHCPGLFFAGEVIDVDAITGGFNLQAAWTMGYVVGQHIGEQ